MLLHQILTAVDNRIDNTVYWTDTKKTAYANDCLRSIVAHFEIKFKGYHIFYTVDGQQRYTIPVDFISSEHLYTNTDSLNRTLKFVDSPNKIYGPYSEADELEGAPEQCFLWPVDGKDVLWFRPIPDDEYEIEWWYYREAPLLVNDDDQPIIDSNFHNYIVDYIEGRIDVKDGEMNLLIFDAWWITILKKMSAAKTIQVSDTIDFRPGTGRKNFPSDASANGELLLVVDPTGTIIWGIG